MYTKKTLEMYEHFQLTILHPIAESESAFSKWKSNQTLIDNVREEDHGNIRALPGHDLAHDRLVRRCICGKLKTDYEFIDNGHEADH